MKSFKINVQGIGAAIGLLLVNGIVYLIFHRTPATEEEINAYIQNSEVVELTDFTFFDVERMVTYARQPLRRKPVPALLWYTDPNYKNYEVSEENYRHSVKEYLTYCRTE